MWKRIIIYIIILIVLLGLYFFFTPQSLKTAAEKSAPATENQDETSGFKGPDGAPSVRGPTEQPPRN